MCYILQCVKIQNTVDFTMRPEFASPMAYIMSGPRSIVQRIVDIAKVVILHLKSVLSFLGWIQHRGQKNDPAYEQIHHRINKHLWFYSIYTDQVVNVVNIFR